MFLWKGTELLFQMVINLQTSLGAVHISGKMIVIADLLSHQVHRMVTQPGNHKAPVPHGFLCHQMEHQASHLISSSPMS